MSIRSIRRQSTNPGAYPATPNTTPIYVDSDDNILKMIPAGSGTTEVQIVDASSAQSLSSKTLVGATFTGGTTTNAAAGAAGAAVTQYNNKVLLDNTTADFYTVTVPNVICGASVELLVSSTLGDGDSTDTAIYTVGISRIAGAAAKAVISSKSVVGATAGATANAVITSTISAIGGAVGATNTFTIVVKNARSAGAATNHPTTTRATLVNSIAAGVTIATA